MDVVTRVIESYDSTFNEQMELLMSPGAWQSPWTVSKTRCCAAAVSGAAEQSNPTDDPTDSFLSHRYEGTGDDEESGSIPLLIALRSHAPDDVVLELLRRYVLTIFYKYFSILPACVWVPVRCVVE